MYSVVRTLTISVLALALSYTSAAQRILGELTGTVTDPTQAAISGATVKAVETATQRSWTAVANESGVYRIPSLPSGTQYNVSVSHAGFRTAEVDNVQLDVGEVKRLDFTLEVGAVTETVTVSGAAAALNLERGEVSSVVGSRRIIDLPLNGRNVYQLAELQPGVVRTAGTGLQDSETSDAQVAASGTRYRDNNILLDGVTNNNDRQGGRTNITLSPDAVEQFRVVTNNMSAEFGRSGGAVINVITRAGTNTPHGSAFWFLRNDNLDAATTFEARGGGKSEFKRNQFGGTLGGPIIKDHTFFFFSYQGLRQGQPSLVQASVETPEFRDFVIRTRPNSIAARLLREFPPVLNPTFNIRDIGSPAPGIQVFGPPDGIPDLGDVFIAIPGFTNDDQYSGRLDHTFNGGKDLINGRYTATDRNEQRPGDNSVRAFRAFFTEFHQNFSLNHTHIFSPSIINDLRLGYNYSPQITTGNFQDIPWVGMNVTGRSASQFGQTFGYVFPLDFRLHTYQVTDSVSVTRGNHGIKFGGEFRAFQENSDFPSFMKPLISFQDIFDFADDEVLSINARVDPATGRPVGTYRNFRQKEFGLFVQDDWKATSRLTLNLGLRYDNFGPLKEKNDLLSTLAWASPSVGNAAVVPVDELYRRDNTNFAPRFGFAYDPAGTGNWAIRGGYGMFYSRVWSNFSGNVRFNPPFSLPVSLAALSGQNPSAAYRIPFTGDPAFARPLDALGGSTAFRPAVQTVDRDLSTPYTHQWFAGVQRKFGSDWVAEVNYMGNAGRKLLIRNEINRYSGDRADGVFNRVNQSFGSIIHGYNAATSIYNGLSAQLTRRFSQGYTAQFTYTFSRSIDTDSEPFGSTGPSEQQGTMEVGNLRLDRGLSAFDVRHRFAANFVWELPFLRNTQNVIGSLLGGWQLNGILSMQSGFPFTVTTSEDYNLDGVFSDRPNAAKAVPRNPGDGPRDFLNGAFGPRSDWGTLFQPAPAGASGNLGRNTLIGPGYANFDLSMIKSFRTPWFTSDGSHWEFRAEFFNLFNRVNLRPPSVSLGSYSAATGQWSNVNFGKSLSSFDARQIQFGLKFRF